MKINTEKKPGNNLGNLVLDHNQMKILITILVTIPLGFFLYVIWGLHKFNKDFQLTFYEWLEEDEPLFPINKYEDENESRDN